MANKAETIPQAMLRRNSVRPAEKAGEANSASPASCVAKALSLRNSRLVVSMPNPNKANGTINARIVAGELRLTRTSARAIARIVAAWNSGLKTSTAATNQTRQTPSLTSGLRVFSTPQSAEASDQPRPKTVPKDRPDREAPDRRGAPA